jgi:hypothetical protein
VDVSSIVSVVKFNQSVIYITYSFCINFIKVRFEMHVKMKLLKEPW